MASPPYDEIAVAGLPVRLGYNANGFFATATFQTVYILGSPLIVALDPPVAMVEEVSLPALLVALLGALAGGAIIQ